MNAPALHSRFGLALSGGGFRASFFHLGALRRLAELDLLRHVTDISTVSGGSIVAAHYYLHFKRIFERQNGVLLREHYMEIVDAVEKEFLRGNRADLRNRLLMSPLTHLSALMFGRGYGPRMAQLYTKYFYRDVTEEIFGKSQLSGAKSWIKNGIPLHRAITILPDQNVTDRLPNKSSSYPNSGEVEPPLADFNRKAGYATIPRLLMNATCLNTGGPFHFLLNEVGGPESGYVRYDELFMLLQYKVLISSVRQDSFTTEFLASAMKRALDFGAELERNYAEMPPTAFSDGFPAATEEHLRIYIAAKERLTLGDVPPTAASWTSQRFGIEATTAVTRWIIGNDAWFAMRHLLECDFGKLRRVKVAAWNLLDDRGWLQPNRGGWTRDDYERDFWRALRNIDKTIAAKFQSGGEPDLRDLTTFLLHVYYFRSAEALGWEAPRALRKLTLSHAVAASANFPPVFTPFKIFNLYDAGRFDGLSLTDGGVHDNQGVDALLDGGCAYIIVSDAGGLVRQEYRPADARLPMMDRVIDLLMGGVRRALMNGLERNVEVAKLAAGTHAAAAGDPDVERIRESTLLQSAAIFHMTSNPLEGSANGLPGFAQREVAHIRTDLDAFTELESGALRHQGYQLADRYVQWFAKNPPFGSPDAHVPPPVRPVPNLPVYAERKHRRLLDAGSHLAGRFSAAHPLLAASIAAIFALVMWIVPHPTFGDLREAFEHDFGEAPQQGAVIHALGAVSSRIELLSGRNAIAVIVGLWAIVMLFREAVRRYRNRTSKSLVTVGGEVWKGRLRWAVSLLTRPVNLVSLFCAIVFTLTLEVKWLFGILPLWCVPLGLFFVFIHYVFTSLWLRAGRLPRPPAPLRTTVRAALAGRA